MLIEKLKASALFAGMTEMEIKQALDEIPHQVRHYAKGEVVLPMGSTLEDLGIMIAGRLTICQRDAWGNEHILALMEPGGLFGESYACLPGEPLQVEAAAQTDTKVLLINVKELLSGSGGFRMQLAGNLLAILARKNQVLSRKLSYLSYKSIRERVMAYLGDECVRQGSRVLTIPFSRQEMADYLCVDRSALSAELSRMREEGLLRYHKNQFELEVDIHDSY